MQRRLRVCMVSPLYHPGLGGVGRQAVYLSEFLHRSGLQIMIMCRDILGMPEWTPEKKMKIVRIKATDNRKFDLAATSIYNIIISVSFGINLLLKLIKHRDEYDIVHFHGASLPLILNVLPLKLLRKKIVAKVAGARNGIEAGSFRGKYCGIGNLFIRILNNVDVFVVISDEIFDGLIDDGFSKDKLFRTSNFINADLFSPGSNDVRVKKVALKVNPGKHVIIFSGRLVPQKRADILLRAIALIEKNRDDFIVLILGQGSLYEELLRLATELDLGNRVEFRGFVANIVDYLHIASMYVLTSDHEGMSNALLEAMACKLPVISTRVGAVTDIIMNGKNGLVVETGDPLSVKNAIMSLLDEPELRERLADGAYTTIKGRFGIDVVAKKYIGLYESITT